MKAIFKTLNNLPIFDPGRWPHRELVARLAGISICVAFVVHRIFRFDRYTGGTPPFLEHLAGALSGERSLSGINLLSSDRHWIMWFSVWVIETGIFMGYILAFMSRREAKSVAKGFMEVVFPVLVAALPIVITLTPMNFRDVWLPLLQRPAGHQASAASVWGWEPAFFVFLAIILFGGMVNLIGLFTLRRAFTIMSEARMHIRQGIFKFLRHPLYAGHFVMFFGYLMFHLYWYTCILYILFLAGQYQRARIEEAKLLSVFPEYAGYMEATGMFFPRLQGKGNRAA